MEQITNLSTIKAHLIDLLFAQKINTAVTGIGLAIASSTLGINGCNDRAQRKEELKQQQEQRAGELRLIQELHRDEMDLIRGMHQVQHNSVHIDRPKTPAELKDDLIREQVKVLTKPKDL